ncbi:MBL fold metallo-hydrolase [Dyadobacter luteus]|uniref:MBL fold metallo-hydrolase n=1 Tax=Dyadobacter luteus TaxID=2259619 RepID=A0A3D8YBR5_9BACT|nr:MBL fold metallo-hydrolase [Dyadobacter luteus]REA61602.1 MBL fold metallo-hydrolase [Dyadobacter luteus]
MIQVQSFTFNPFSENTYVLSDETGEAVIIDPGCHNKAEFAELYQYIETNALKPISIVNTHAHIDHVLGVEAIKIKYNIPFYLHQLDEPVLKAVRSYASNYGFPAFDEPAIDGYLKEGEKISFGSSQLDILFVPGHAPGHVAFVSHEQQFVIGGDVLFRQSIGRTDLPAGNFDVLINSIKTQLFTLGDAYKVYAGHMGPTTIGFEKKNNPFLK